MRLRTSLFLLSLATALPLVAFALLAAAFVVKHENENLVSVAKARNRAVLSAVDAELRGTIGTLRSIAVVRSLANDELQLFHATVRDILATQPGWNNVLLHDPTGRQLVNASKPWGTPLLAEPVAPRSIAAAVQTLQPAIDDLAAAPLLNNQLGIPVRVPVVREGKAVYVLTAVVRPEAFQRVIGAQDMPTDWASGLVDSRGRLIARVPHRPPGTMASAAYLENIRSADEGWYRGATLDGTDTFTAFLRSDLTGWTIGYAVPSDAGARRHDARGLAHGRGHRRVDRCRPCARPVADPPHLAADGRAGHRGEGDRQRRQTEDGALDDRRDRQPVAGRRRCGARDRHARPRDPAQRG